MVCHTFQGGELVAVVKGANAPLLRKTILHQLEVEKKVLAEGRERNVVSGGHSSNWQTHKCAHLGPLPMSYSGLFFIQALGECTFRSFFLSRAPGTSFIHFPFTHN